MTNNLHYQRAGIKTTLLSLGFRYHQIQIMRLEFLHHCGHQIRVNNETGSYVIEEEYFCKSVLSCLSNKHIMKCLRVK